MKPLLAAKICVRQEPIFESFDHIIIYPGGAAISKLLIKAWNNFII